MLSISGLHDAFRAKHTSNHADERACEFMVFDEKTTRQHLNCLRMARENARGARHHHVGNVGDHQRHLAEMRDYPRWKLAGSEIGPSSSG
jgi:hypothetical protein